MEYGENKKIVHCCAKMRDVVCPWLKCQFWSRKIGFIEPGKEKRYRWVITGNHHMDGHYETIEAKK